MFYTFWRNNSKNNYFLKSWPEDGSNYRWPLLRSDIIGFSKTNSRDRFRSPSSSRARFLMRASTQNLDFNLFLIEALVWLSPVEELIISILHGCNLCWLAHWSCCCCHVLLTRAIHINLTSSCNQLRFVLKCSLSRNSQFLKISATWKFLNFFQFSQRGWK